MVFHHCTSRSFNHCFCTPSGSIFPSAPSYWPNAGANLYSNIAAASAGHMTSHHPSHMTSHIASYPHYAWQSPTQWWMRCHSDDAVAGNFWGCRQTGPHLNQAQLKSTCWFVCEFNGVLVPWIFLWCLSMGFIGGSRIFDGVHGVPFRSGGALFRPHDVVKVWPNKGAPNCIAGS